MPGQSFRFLQSGNFQLHRAVQGLTEVPDELAEILIDAAQQSAKEVFQAAIREAVDFVLLTGDLLDPTAAGPRAVAFLQHQLLKLEQHQIPVYWCASRMDLTGGWLRGLEWPGNVQIFSSERVDELQLVRADETIAVVRGRSWHQQRPLRTVELAGQRHAAFQVAVVHSEVALEQPLEAVDFWALAEPARSTSAKSESFAHCAGAPQAFGPAQPGPRGCTLVQVSGDGDIRTRSIETDTVRWCHEQIGVSSSVSRSEIRAALKARAGKLSEEAKRPLLVSWTIAGEDRFDTVLADEPSRLELLEWLREQFGDRTPAVWSVSLELQPPEALPAQWTEEDSILGDFLRVVQQYLEDPERDFHLQQHTQDHRVPNELAAALSLTDREVRNRVLREAAVLGADLLRGDESETAR